VVGATSMMAFLVLPRHRRGRVRCENAFLLFVCACEGRTAVHRAVEVHGQRSNTSGTDLQGVKDSTDIIRLLVLHGADINQPV